MFRIQIKGRNKWSYSFFLFFPPASSGAALPGLQRSHEALLHQWHASFSVELHARQQLPCWEACHEVNPSFQSFQAIAIIRIDHCKKYIYFWNALFRISRFWKGPAYYQGTGYSEALVKWPNQVKRKVLRFRIFNNGETNALLFYIGNKVWDSFSWQSRLFAPAEGGCCHNGKVDKLYFFCFPISRSLFSACFWRGAS